MKAKVNTSDLKSFYYLESGEITFSTMDTQKTAKTLEPGCYDLNWLPYPESRVKVSKNKDVESVKIHSFPDRPKLDELFNAFFDSRIYSKVNSLGFYHKVGILLHGKEGTGKSTILKYYYSKAIKEQNAIVFNILQYDYDIKQVWEFVTNVRSIQSNPFIILFEEFDSHIAGRASQSNESFLKTVIDGNMSIDNCVFLATTNYIDNIPAAMKDRPSRFKYVLDIEGVQNKNEVFSIINAMLGDSYTQSEIDNYARELQGSTLDAIKQFCLNKIMDIKTYNKKRSVVGFLQN